MCKLRWTCYERWGKECERCGINIGKLASRLCNSAQEKARYYTDRIGTSLFLKRFEFSSIVAAVSSSFALVHRLKVMVMGVQQRAFIYQVERFFYYFCIDPVMRFDFFFFFPFLSYSNTSQMWMIDIYGGLLIVGKFIFIRFF